MDPPVQTPAPRIPALPTPTAAWKSQAPGFPALPHPSPGKKSLRTFIQLLAPQRPANSPVRGELGIIQRGETSPRTLPVQKASFPQRRRGAAPSPLVSVMGGELSTSNRDVATGFGASQRSSV